MFGHAFGLVYLVADDIFLTRFKTNDAKIVVKPFVVPFGVCRYLLPFFWVCLFFACV